LHSVVVALAVDAIVRNHVTSVLTSVNSASISGGDTLADCHGRSIESTLRGGGGGRGGGGTSHVLTLDLSGLHAFAFLARIVVDFSSDVNLFPVASAGTLVLRASSLAVLVTAAVVASIAGGESLTNFVGLSVSDAFTRLVGAGHLHVGSTGASVASVRGRNGLSRLEELVVEGALAFVLRASDHSVLLANASVAFHVE